MYSKSSPFLLRYSLSINPSMALLTSIIFGVNLLPVCTKTSFNKVLEGNCF